MLRPHNTDNKGKLFPAFFMKKRDTFCFCSCTQDKFVMAVAPGHSHLPSIKILHLDSFLAPRHPDSYRMYRDSAPVPATNFVTGDNPMAIGTRFRSSMYRDTRNALKNLYHDGKKCTIPLFWEKSGNTTSPYCRAVRLSNN